MSSSQWSTLVGLELAYILTWVALSTTNFVWYSFHSISDTCYICAILHLYVVSLECDMQQHLHLLLHVSVEDSNENIKRRLYKKLQHTLMVFWHICIYHIALWSLHIHLDHHVLFHLSLITACFFCRLSHPPYLDTRSLTFHSLFPTSPAVYCFLSWSSLPSLIVYSHLSTIAFICDSL